jgi:spore maturation protein CgeB
VIVSDSWPGLDTVFEPGQEILLADSSTHVLQILDEISAEERAEIGAAARRRVLAEHTADRRVDQLHELTRIGGRAGWRGRGPITR